MTTTYSTPQKSKTRLPPKRGQIKAQIINGFATSVASTISKAGESLRNVVGNGGGSASSTPFPNDYNSEGKSNV